MGVRARASPELVGKRSEAMRATGLQLLRCVGLHEEESPFPRVLITSVQPRCCDQLRACVLAPNLCKYLLCFVLRFLLCTEDQ